MRIWYTVSTTSTGPQQRSKSRLKARLLCLGVGTHVSCKGSLAVSRKVRAATMPARAAAMR
jgi:hypothetical protein